MSRNLNYQLLQIKAETLRNFIQEVYGLYHNGNTSKDQKELIETIIGAGIWYLPIGVELFSGFISKGAITSLSRSFQDIIAEDPLFSSNNEWKFKLTEEHRFPRKMAAFKLLTDYFEHVKSGLDSFIELYVSEIGQFNLVLPDENKRLIKHQKKAHFEDVEAPYKMEGIDLLIVEKTFYVDYKSILRKIVYRKKREGVKRIYKTNDSMNDMALKNDIKNFLLAINEYISNNLNIYN